MLPAKEEIRKRERQSQRELENLVNGGLGFFSLASQIKEAEAMENIEKQEHEEKL